MQGSRWHMTGDTWFDAFLHTGAWEKVDDTVDSDSSSSHHDFDDDYDPAAEADKVGQAFGDYKQTKKERRQQEEAGPVEPEFDDAYNPEVDTSDPLANAFGDGFRVAKPKEVSPLNYQFPWQCGLYCNFGKSNCLLLEKIIQN